MPLHRIETNSPFLLVAVSPAAATRRGVAQTEPVQIGVACRAVACRAVACRALCSSVCRAPSRNDRLDSACQRRVALERAQTLLAKVLLCSAAFADVSGVSEPVPLDLSRGRRALATQHAVRIGQNERYSSSLHTAGSGESATPAGGRARQPFFPAAIEPRKAS